jgi:hypothetical protein
MTPARLGLMAAIGLAALASSVLFVRRAPDAACALLDRVYS